MGTVVSAVRISDEALAARVRRGDQRAFEELYERYRDRLHRYCASILRQPEDAEEAVQSAMLGAYRALAGGEFRAYAVRPWLYRIAHNQCIGMLRHRASRPTEPLTGLEVLGSQDVVERVETADELARLSQDLQSLPPEQRSALVLRELSGLSHEQIALVLDQAPSTVKQLIYQARLGLHAMADGRALGCDTVRRRISDGDGRVLRSRGMGAHLRTCATCRAFREGLRTRPAKLAALFPVGPAVIGRDLIGALGGGGVSAAGGLSLAGGGGIALKLALVVTVGIVGASAVVAPRVIGEPGHADPPAAAVHAHATTTAAASGLTIALAAPVADPPEVDAAPPVFDLVPPDAVPAHPAAPAAHPVGAVTDPAAADPLPAAATTDAAPPSPPPPAAATRRSRGPVSVAPGGGGGTPAAQRRPEGAPGRPGDAPGQSGAAPGRSGQAPGQSGATPPAQAASSGAQGPPADPPAADPPVAAAAQGPPADLPDPPAAAAARGTAEGSPVR